VLMGINYVSICDGSSSQQQFHFAWMEDGQRREFGTRICWPSPAACNEAKSDTTTAS
jgi:hypothetical protein